MTTLRHTVHRILPALVSVMVIAACADGTPPSPIAPEASLAKGPPSGGSPKVTSTDPSSGEQGQRLSVRVLGSGYNPTAVASWERNGTTDPKITVNSTTFISSSEVVADITIDAEADVDLYDVAVEIIASDGSRKKGIGIEKFEVNPGPHPPNSTATASGAIVSDGPQAVKGVEGDSTVSFQLGGNGQQGYVFRAYLSFQNTYNTFKDAVRLGQPACGYDPADKPGTTDDDRRARMFAKLVDPAFHDAQAMNVQVYKPALGTASTNHAWAIHWMEGADSLFTLNIGEAPKLLPGPLPTVDEIVPYSYRFTGGALKFIDRTGQAKNHLWIVCPNLDEAVLTWYPPVP